MSSFRVVLVEDDPMVREVNRQFIERVEGFELIATAGNGKEGLQIIEELQPDLVFMDIFMPGIDGLETLREIRHRHIDVDVITVTAANDMPTIQRILHLGVFDYIMKPFTFHRMEQTLLNYKQFRMKTAVTEDVTQQQLDALMQKQLAKPPLAAPTENSQKTEELILPKGFNKTTLDKVLQFIESKEYGASADEVAQAIGVARVTARRYLDFMEKQCLIEVENVYGNVGRPINKYLKVLLDKRK